MNDLTDNQIIELMHSDKEFGARVQLQAKRIIHAQNLPDRNRYVRISRVMPKGMTAKQANATLIHLGLMEKRAGKFIVTEKGLEYGVNFQGSYISDASYPLWDSDSNITEVLMTQGES